jgi:hypothetical protein
LTRAWSWGALILALSFLLIPYPLHAQADERVVINEIHYNPHLPLDHVEFVELYNRSGVSVNISGWRLDGAVEYIFPNNIVLEPYQYAVVAQDPGQLRSKFGLENAFGPYRGKLNNDGEEVILRSDAGPRVDAVDYGPAFPWPIVGVDPGYSIQLLNPREDNQHPGSWRAAPPSPGVRNRVYVENIPPQIAEVEHQPQAPTSGDTVTIAAAVQDRDGIAAVTLSYQLVAPGSYVPLNDPAYNQGWQTVAMTLAEDGRYQAILPADLQRHRHLIRYRISATDETGQTVHTPYTEDPQPNFAYFVYDGVPAWRGSIDGGTANAADHDFSRMAALPVYHLIARSSDVSDAQFIPDTPRPYGYEGNDYLWYGTLVYDDVVYDHVGFRARGGFTRYATGKNMWKFNFYRGHRFEARDNYDRPYDVAWDKLNLSAVIQQSHRGYRGEQGMFESMSFRLFNLAGIEGPLSHFIHFRVIDDAYETGGSQYENDFWGLYLAIEQMDGRFLEEHDLPNGNLYKMEVGATERNNHSPAGVGEWNDLWYFVNTALGTPTLEWWRDFLDLERYYAYRAIVEAVHHYDINQGKNYFYYHNPETGKWSVHPWDVDLTWANDMAGTGVEPLLQALSHPTLNLEYQNTVRGLRDLLFNEEQMDRMLREHAAFINTPADGLSMVDADRAMWDYNPVYATRYVDPERTGPGQFYTAAESRDFPGMVERMRTWVRERGRWIDETILTDRDFPATPQASYSGANGYPVDELRFTTTRFSDPQGEQTFGGLQWRIAEVTDPAAPVYRPDAPLLYEINAVYESPIMGAFQESFTPPPGIVTPGHAYRVRVRMRDNSGRWSHWSAPVAFVAGPARGAAANDLRISEIMYHPAPLGELDDTRLEFIELTNAGTQALYLGRSQIGGGIEYTFADGLTLEPGAFVVLASDHDAFFDRYGFRPFDEYDRQLSNGGETITLSDAYGRTLAEIAYEDEGAWPAAADGEGPSLVINRLDGDPAAATNWRASRYSGGSPGAADPLPIVINEIQLRTAQSDAATFELYNPTELPADISHWRLNDDRSATPELVFPAGTLIPPQSYRVFSKAYFGGQDTGLLRFPRTGGMLELRSAGVERYETGYVANVRFQGFDTGLAYGRHVTSEGRAFFVPQAEPTLGRVNRGPRTGELVIGEIMYHPTTGEEFVTIHNVSAAPVTLYDRDFPDHTWRLDGALFAFPSGIQVPAGGTVLIVSGDPAQVCVDHALNPDTIVIGPLGRDLLDEGDELALMRPLAPEADGLVPYLPEDLVVYDDAVPWPTDAAGLGAYLERTAPDAFGSEPNHWRARYGTEGLLAAADGGPAVRLCSFVAAYQEQEEAVAIDWVSSTEENVARFNLWRSRDPSGNRTLLTPQGIPATGGEVRMRYHFVDQGSGANEAARSRYYLEAVGVNGEAINLGYTEPSIIFRTLYLPIVGR